MSRERLASLAGRGRWHLAMGAAATGLALSALPAPVIFGAAAALTAVSGVIRAPAIGVLVAGTLVVGGGLGHARLGATEPARLEGRFAGVVHLLERPRPGPFGSSAAVRVASGPAMGARLLARLGSGRRWPSGAGPGSELAIEGALREPRRSAGSDFDWPAYLRRRGIGTEIELSALRATGGRRDGAAGVVDSIRLRAEVGIAQGLDPPQAALARGMVLGEDGDIDEAVRDDFRAAGLAHVLAVSGQNVMLLSLLALPLLASTGLGLNGRTAVLLGLTALYVPLAGAGPSVQRAGVMGAAALVALLAGRPSSRWYALLLAAVVTLGVNPRACGDVGWQLSFAAVAGILLLAPRLRALVPLPGIAAEGVAVTVAATLATAPLLAHHFGAVSLASLPANVVALPLVAPIMWLGMLQAALGQLAWAGDPAAALGDAAAWLLGTVNGALLDWLAWLAARFAEQPWAQVGVSLGSSGAVVAAYAAIALACAAAALVVKGTPRRPARAARHALGISWRAMPRQGRALVAAAVLGVALIGAQAVLAQPAPPDRLTVSFLDVGQGDATLIQHPDGSAVLFDGGRPEAHVIRLLRRAGVRRLSAVVATHASADHHGGLPGVLERFPVDLLVDGGDGTRDPTFSEMLALARRRGIRTVPAAAGQTLQTGALTIRVLGPVPRPPGPPPEDPNPRGVVAVVSSGGFDLFLSADAESEALLPLDLPDVEAMKVPHHGSRDPGLPQVLERLRPEVAAIEVGEHNTYGHPAPETLAALERAGPAVYRTDRDGTVRLTVDGGRIRVSAGR